ncbi:UNVERIFIED_CONTAM: hypothetical protein GTU68_008210 [Idotea baltica]|nr:hypothetical protein [Idotea baltica]
MLHTGEKPFTCPFCDFRSSYKYQIISHVLQEHDSASDRMA